MCNKKAKSAAQCGKMQKNCKNMELIKLKPKIEKN